MEIVSPLNTAKIRVIFLDCSYHCPLKIAMSADGDHKKKMKKASKEQSQVVESSTSEDFSIQPEKTTPKIDTSK